MTTLNEVKSNTTTAWARLGALTAGPLLCWWLVGELVQSSAYQDTILTVAGVALALMWSPLPFSLPAVMLDHERDVTLPELPPLTRGILLIPTMLASSPARVEVAASLVGWLGLLWVLYGA